MKNKIEMLVGTWMEENNYSRVLINIKTRRGKPLVSAWDRHNKEDFEVTKVDWDGMELSFEVRAPAFEDTVAHRVRPISEDICIHKITLPEILCKASAYGRTKSKLGMLAGDWISSDEDSSIIITIEIKGGKPLVHARDLGDQEIYEISKVKWNGRGLSYQLTVPSTGYVSFSEIRPLSRNRAMEYITFEERRCRRPDKATAGAAKKPQAKVKRRKPQS